MTDQEINSTDVVEQEPMIISTLDYEQMPLMKDEKKLIHALQQEYLTAKEIHEKIHPDVSERTVYRKLKKLLKEKLIIEVGYRKTEGSRVTETLYAAKSKIIYYTGPEIMDEWRSDERKSEIKLIYLWVREKLNLNVDFETFYEYALDYLQKQDKISDELLEIAEDNSEFLNVLQNIPTQRLSHLIFYATNLVMITDLSEKFKSKNKVEL